MNNSKDVVNSSEYDVLSAEHDKLNAIRGEIIGYLIDLEFNLDMLFFHVFFDDGGSDPAYLLFHSHLYQNQSFASKVELMRFVVQQMKPPHEEMMYEWFTKLDKLNGVRNILAHGVSNLYINGEDPHSDTLLKDVMQYKRGKNVSQDLSQSALEEVRLLYRECLSFAKNELRGENYELYFGEIKY